MQQPSSTELAAVAQAGVAALQRGDAAAARRAFDQVAAAGRASPQLWLLLAQACDQLDDRPAAHAALDRVLAADERNAYALVLKGDLFARSGDDRAAISFYQTALRSTAGADKLPPDLVARLRRAAAARDALAGRFQDHVQARLTAAGVGGARVPPRFAEALGILAGIRQPYFQEPTSFFYPGLPHIAFYDPANHPWIAELEAAAPAMRAEIEAVLAQDRGVVPYVERPENRWSRGHSLLNDARWSAFHLWKNGRRVEEHAARCPRTIAALEAAPIPHIAKRSPMALFSILKPKTHIPPHNGMLNTRLICHIPLIVPPGCRLRVGNETRVVEEGKALLFDDSIEHEAWNDSEAPRAILLFEVWRPELSADERAALTVLFEAVSLYPGVGEPAQSSHQ